MVIDKKIFMAILAATQRHGSQAAVATLCKIKEPMLSRYISGETKKIEGKTWERMYPVLRQWLGNDPAYMPRSMIKGGGHMSPPAAANVPPEILELRQAMVLTIKQAIERNEHGILDTLRGLLK